jgi:DtxR family Mn-dependent transcriptional regulator
MVDLNTREEAFAPFSESVQTYLVTIVRLRVDGRPVPLSQLAQELSISSVSVNEMCRKLQEQGLVIYRPYQGASLTPEGEQRAYYVLRRHRLWEVFLVERLGLDYEEAHEAACRLEHVTSNAVADRLDTFLGYPTVNPKGDPIPTNEGALPAQSLIPLTSLSVGRGSHVVVCEGDDPACTFLNEQGLRPGARVALVADAEDALLVQVGGKHISLARSLAETVQVEQAETEGETAPDVPPKPIPSDEERMEMQSKTETVIRQVPLHELSVGQRGIVVRVGGRGPGRRRMMDMGLVPGTEVKVVRVAPLGDPVEFEVKGYSLSLRKSEARDITVEVVR